MTIIETLKAQIAESQAKIKEIQEQCSHPLVARKTENRRATGNYDDPEGSYWTDHFCGLCEAKWTTDQSWKQDGDGLGLPKK
jgi:hypothetical protein